MNENYFIMIQISLKFALKSRGDSIRQPLVPYKWQAITYTTGISITIYGSFMKEKSQHLVHDL